MKQLHWQRAPLLVAQTHPEESAGRRCLGCQNTPRVTRPACLDLAALCVSFIELEWVLFVGNRRVQDPPSPLQRPPGVAWRQSWSLLCGQLCWASSSSSPARHGETVGDSPRLFRARDSDHAVPHLLAPSPAREAPRERARERGMQEREEEREQCKQCKREEGVLGGLVDLDGRGAADFHTPQGLAALANQESSDLDSTVTRRNTRCNTRSSLFL